MNKIFHSVFALAISVLLFNSPLRAAEAITYQQFYDELSPYGTWIDYPNYGHVWHPDEVGFRPYATNGYWEYTNDGWFWNSDYDWGWAPFHYGSWLYDNNLGWLWVPGYDWAPAWVTWGNVDGYYAWAPLEPGIDVDAEFGDWRPHDYYWNIVDRDHIYDRDLSGRLLSPDRVKTVANRVSVINNFHDSGKGRGYFAKGPEVKDVEKYTRRNIAPVSAKEVERMPQAGIAGHKASDDRISADAKSNKTVNVYKPMVLKPEPAQYSKATIKDVSPVRSSDAGHKWPSENLERHADNIRNMPVRESPMSAMRNEPAMRSEPAMRATPAIHGEEHKR